MKEIAVNPSASTSIPARRRRRSGRWSGTSVAELVALLALITFLVTPILWMVSTSLKSTNQTFAVPPVFVFKPTLEHYRLLIDEGRVLPTLLNSLMVAIGSSVLALVLGTPAAYALARFDFRGKSHLWFWIISNRFISPIVVAVPFFLLARDLSLLNTRLVLILVYLTFNLPLVIWLCIDQFRAVPREVENAAFVDGAGQWRIFRDIAFPLALPGVAVSGILCFVFSWNEFLFALVLTREEARTAPVEAANFMTGFGVRWGEMMATGSLIVLPVVLFAALASRYLVRGLTMGAVK
jgi:multiple sugar transport system permease protein